MKDLILYFFIIFIILLFFLFNNKIVENFYVTTWTPYVIDIYNQPGYTNYFFDNGYMYPIY